MRSPDLRRLWCRAVDGAHQPLIRIEAWERVAFLRTPDSSGLSQKIVGSRPCPRGETTVAWLTGP